MKKGRFIGLLALTLVPALTLAFSPLSDSGTNMTTHYASILAGPGFTVAIATLILTAAVLREERDGGTLPYIYMRPIARRSIAASSISAGILAALSVVVTFGGLIFFTTTTIGYAAVFVPLGYLVSRSLLVGLGYLFVMETILANAVSGLAQLSIWRIGLSIYLGFEGDVDESVIEEFLGSVKPGAGGGLAKLAVVVAIGYSVLLWALRKRDAL
jgi:ABC-type transport system involved in multi-copper enzyme maturation permease subunit